MSAWTCRHTDGKVVQQIVPPRPRIPWWKGPGADFREKQEPASDIDTALVDSLKVLDLKGPIREADIAGGPVRAKGGSNPCMCVSTVFSTTANGGRRHQTQLSK